MKNRLNFEGNAGTRSSAARPPSFSILVAPIRKFRWVHFPFNAELPGAFTSRVTPVFMNANGEPHYGIAQLAKIDLARETDPGLLNVAFTRGFVSSQAFVDRYASKGPSDTLLPATSKQGLTFVPTHPRKDDGYQWMGFEARREILKRLPKSKVRVIIDDSDDHHGEGAASIGVGSVSNASMLSSAKDGGRSIR